MATITKLGWLATASASRARRGGPTEPGVYPLQVKGISDAGATSHPGVGDGGPREEAALPRRR